MQHGLNQLQTVIGLCLGNPKEISTTAVGWRHVSFDSRIMAEKRRGAHRWFRPGDCQPTLSELEKRAPRFLAQVLVIRALFDFGEQLHRRWVGNFSQEVRYREISLLPFVELLFQLRHEAR